MNVSDKDMDDLCDVVLREIVSFNKNQPRSLGGVFAIGKQEVAILRGSEIVSRIRGGVERLQFDLGEKLVKEICNAGPCVVDVRARCDEKFDRMGKAIVMDAYVAKAHSHNVVVTEGFADTGRPKLKARVHPSQVDYEMDRYYPMYATPPKPKPVPPLAKRLKSWFAKLGEPLPYDGPRG